MARIRSIHPGFFTDERLVSTSLGARLLFLGVGVEADDKGIFEWKPITLKMRILDIETDVWGGLLTAEWNIDELEWENDNFWTGTYSAEDIAGFWAVTAAYQAGRNAERTAALTTSVEILRERSAIDDQTRSMDSGSLCRALGGVWVPDDGTCQ